MSSKINDSLNLLLIQEEENFKYKFFKDKIDLLRYVFTVEEDVFRIYFREDENVEYVEGLKRLGDDLHIEMLDFATEFDVSETRVLVGLAKSYAERDTGLESKSYYAGTFNFDYDFTITPDLKKYNFVDIDSQLFLESLEELLKGNEE